MPAGAPPPSLEPGLARWAASRFGPRAEIVDIADLGGHSGETYGFGVLCAGGRMELVVRIAPAGVARRGSTDVLRQAPLLRTLFANGVRTPRVIDACDDESLLGAPFLVVEKLSGAPLTMGPKANPPGWAREGRQAAYLCAAEQLAALHAVDATHLAAWERRRSPREEIEAWTPLLERSPAPEWTVMGAALKDRLLARLPATHTVGVCHGDYQTNNILFSCERGQVAVEGIVDWEVAHIGAVELDLAWLMMMNDPEAWDPVEQRGDVDLEAVRQRYEGARGARVEELAWFWALACYRIAAIAAYNIRLHRNGRRPDADWERASSSVPVFFARAHALLEAA